MQINRLLEIVYILLNKKTVRAKELAQRFGVSQRTIYRDVDVLSLAKIPVYTEKGRGGGIGLLPGFVLNKSILSEKEQQEILAALQGLAAVSATQTDPILQKLSAIFNRNSASWVDVDFSDWNLDNRVAFQNLKTAILGHWVVEFDYYGAHRKKSRRSIEPLQLCFRSKAWYLKGFCLLRQDWRLFKILRMKNLAVTNEPCQERQIPVFEFEVSSILDKAWTALELKIAPEMVYRVYDDFPEGQIELLSDGSCLVFASWPEDDWLYGYILSYGEYAQVIKPVHIRDIIKNKAQKIIEK